MSFLSPNFLLAAAVIALPLLLHLLRRRVTRTIPFPSLRFLAASKPTDRSRQNLRRLIVLALRCLALVALALAFARPFFGAAEPPVGRATVIIVDNSYSLQAGQRWSELVRWAANQATPFNTRDTLGVLLMNPRPTWLVAPTRDSAAALRALEALPAGWHATRAEPALRLAGDTLAASAAAQRHIIYLGDHQAAGWAGADFTRQLPPGITLAWPPPAEQPTGPQAAISDLRLRRDGEQLVADLAVRNFSAHQQRAVRIHLNGAPQFPLLEPIDLPADSIATLSIPLPGDPASIHWIRATLDPDTLPADDIAWAVAPASADAANLVILDPTPSTDFVATALHNLQTLDIPLRVGPATAPRWPARAVAVMRHDASFADDAARKLDAHLAAGGTALIFLNGEPAQRRWLAAHDITPQALPADSARIGDWTIEHPLVAPLAETSLRSLVGWTFSRAWSLPADTVEPIASWSDGTPALGELRIGAGRVLLAGWTPDRRDGDWPVSAAFVPFLHRSVLHLLDLAQTTAAATARVGHQLDLPTGGTLTQIDGPATTTAANPPDAPGLYRWTHDGEISLHAVNLVADEGDLTPWPSGMPWQTLASTDPAPTPSITRQNHLAAAEAEQNSPLWWWCFAALALFLLIELPLANRTSR